MYPLCSALAVAVVVGLSQLSVLKVSTACRTKEIAKVAGRVVQRASSRSGSKADRQPRNATRGFVCVVQQADGQTVSVHVPFCSRLCLQAAQRLWYPLCTSSQQCLRLPKMHCTLYRFCSNLFVYTCERRGVPPDRLQEGASLWLYESESSPL